MTLFGKVLIGLMLATAAILIVKGEPKDENIIVDDVSENTNEITSIDGEEKFSGSVKDLVGRGGDYECTFIQTNDMSDSTGTVYVSGKKIRGDFKTTVKAVSDMKVESYMISDGESIYSWSSMVPTGFKIAVVESSTTSSTSSSQSFDYNQKLDYDCKKWTVDDSKFLLPSEIKFTEIKS